MLLIAAAALAAAMQWVCIWACWLAELRNALPVSDKVLVRYVVMKISCLKSLRHATTQAIHMTMFWSLFMFPKNAPLGMELIVECDFILETLMETFLAENPN